MEQDDGLKALLGDAADELDLFDRLQLRAVLEVCRQADSCLLYTYPYAPPFQAFVEVATQ